MGSHIIDGEFQSDKYPTCPRGKVPLSVKDRTAQDLLWEYARRRRAVDAEFSDDLEASLRTAGYDPGDAARFPLTDDEMKTARGFIANVMMQTGPNVFGSAAWFRSRATELAKMLEAALGEVERLRVEQLRHSRRT
jgi:hypothetical protein